MGTDLGCHHERSPIPRGLTGFGQAVRDVCLRHPLTADDFVFAYQVYSAPGLSTFIPTPQDRMSEVLAQDPSTVVIRWRSLYADAGLLKYGDLDPLPRHILEPMFSAFALQGIESKKKGEFTREELASLAEVNVTSLKEYEYFTYATANGKKLEFVDPPTGYYLDFDKKETVLTLHFTLPLKRPLKAKSLTVEVYDPEFFIAFELAEKDPAKLVGAPAQCKLTVGKPQEMNAALAQQFSQLAVGQRQDVEGQIGQLDLLAGRGDRPAVGQEETFLGRTRIARRFRARIRD